MKFYIPGIIKEKDEQFWKKRAFPRKITAVLRDAVWIKGGNKVRTTKTISKDKGKGKGKGKSSTKFKENGESEDESVKDLFNDRESEDDSD